MDPRRKIVDEAVASRRDELHAVNQFLWKNPETRFEEHKAHDCICRFLEDEGFAVQRHYILQTAFRAEYGAGSPVVALLCEYDALPGLGHACGHNLIAESALAALVAVRELMRWHQDSFGTNIPGTVVLLGTPAEEGGMGKEFLLKAGAFEGVDAALIAHPANISCLRMLLSARCTLGVVFEAPEDLNTTQPRAMDAAVLAYTNLSLLRERLGPDSRLHGVLLRSEPKNGLDVQRTQLEFAVRAQSLELLTSLRKDFACCMEAAAVSTGCKVTVTEMAATCKSMKLNETLLNLFGRHSKHYGMTFVDEEDCRARAYGATSDAGNVSHRLPTIHPLYRINSASVMHTDEFGRAAGTQESHEQALDVGKVLALTTYDLLRDRRLVEAAWDQFYGARKYPSRIYN
ncbi:xaa-Arg dipeptidase-like isoform X1 [Haemaphysalis longicornis]